MQPLEILEQGLAYENGNVGRYSWLQCADCTGRGKIGRGKIETEPPSFGKLQQPSRHERRGRFLQ
jgi:hypothetical protein